MENQMEEYAAVMSQFQRMKEGKVYFPTDSEIWKVQNVCLEKLYDFNQTRPSQGELRTAMLKDMFAEFGERCYIEPPLRANWGGYHVHFGHDVYANFNLTLVDDTDIYVGNHVMFGPNVTVVTAGHTIEPQLRRKQAQFNQPVTIEDNVWVGAGVTILPGVTIGANSVIGAGSIVTKDIPANVVAYGNPCQVHREIGPRDKEFYYKDLRLDL